MRFYNLEQFFSNVRDFFIHLADLTSFPHSLIRQNDLFKSIKMNEFQIVSFDRSTKSFPDLSKTSTIVSEPSIVIVVYLVPRIRSSSRRTTPRTGKWRRTRTPTWTSTDSTNRYKIKSKIKSLLKVKERDIELLLLNSHFDVLEIVHFDPLAFDVATPRLLLKYHHF